MSNSDSGIINFDRSSQRIADPTIEKITDRDFKEISITYDEHDKILWCFFDQLGRPCFTFDLGDEIEKLQKAIENKTLISDKVGNENQYVVFGSNTPNIYNLGGDLELFIKNIRNDDIEMMKKYAKQSVDILYRNITCYKSDVITIGLVQGNALGGGFEFAMSFDILVAEKNTKFGLPEILFNLFPGMGAYSFLVRRIGRVETEKMIFNGSMYTGQELYDLGVIDILAEDGEGQATVTNYITTNRKRFHAEKSIYDARKLASPICKKELLDITYNWAEMSMKLNDADLRKMEKLVSAQKRLSRNKTKQIMT